MTQPEKTLIPADNFEVRSLQDQAVHFPNGYIGLKGFGIWDKKAGGWVSFHAEEIRFLIGRPKVQVPYHLERKKWAVLAVSQGLYDGYQVVRPETVFKIGTAPPQPPITGCYARA